MPVYNVFRQQMVVHLRSLCFSQMVMQRRRLRVFHMFGQCSARPCQIGQPATINKQLNLTPGFPRLFQPNPYRVITVGSVTAYPAPLLLRGGGVTGESCRGFFENPPRPTVLFFLISLCMIRSSYKYR